MTSDTAHIIKMIYLISAQSTTVTKHAVKLSEPRV
ncbi:hypothetical protein Tsp_07677 [Trichinella spiralis]|nr:hypothetical protein Tsp_07677 [Trichinella spiralis]